MFTRAANKDRKRGRRASSIKEERRISKVERMG